MRALLRRRRRPAAMDVMPAIVFPRDGFEAWVEEMRPLAAEHWVVQLAFADGSTRDATLKGAGFYGPDQLAGISVVYWTGDQEPPADRAEAIVYSTEITKITIY